MRFTVDEKRAKTMRERLGEASELVLDDRFLPMFRHRQKHYEKFFNYSIGIAKKKNNPARYFAKMWSKENLAKTLSMLGDMIDKVGSTAVMAARKAYAVVKPDAKKADDANSANIININRYEEMRRTLIRC